MNQDIETVQINGVDICVKDIYQPDVIQWKYDPEILENKPIGQLILLTNISKIDADALKGLIEKNLKFQINKFIFITGYITSINHSFYGDISCIIEYIAWIIEPHKLTKHYK